MSDNSFLKSYLRGETSYGFWNFISRGIGTINTFIVIGALTLYEYGSFQILLASYAGLAVLLNVGGGVIRNDVLRFEAEGRSGDAKKLFFELSFLRIGTAVILWTWVFFSAPLLSFKYGPDFIFLIRIISFVFLHDAILSLLTIPIEMKKRFGAIASRLSITKSSQLFILLLALVFYRIDLRVVVVSMVVSLFVGLFFLLKPFLKSYTSWRRVEKSKDNFLLRILSSYGKWEVGEPILNRFTAFFETWAIKLFISTEAVAIFAIAQMLISTMAGFFPVKTLLTLLPIEARNEEKLRKIYTRGTKYLASLSIGLGVAAFFVIPFIISTFFAKYIVSLPYFKALLLTLPLHASIVLSSAFLISLRRQKFLFFQKVLKTLVSVPLYLALLPIFGLWGMVVQGYVWLLVSLASIYVYLLNTQPRLLIRWIDMVRFDNEDKVFLSDTIFSLKNDLGKKTLNENRKIK